MDEDDGTVEVEDVDEDIYGDLESEIFVSSVQKSKKKQEDESYQTIVKENQALKIKVKQLERENKAYSVNISSLYLTAKNEIDKKNFIIKSMQEKLKRLTQAKSKLSNADVDEIITRCQEALQESQSQITLDEIKKSLKSVDSGRDRNRKRIKFGNMSVYFFREQSCFQREEAVVFPTEKSSTASTSEKQVEAGTQQTVSETSQQPSSNNTEDPVNRRNSLEKQSTSYNTSITSSVTCEGPQVPDTTNCLTKDSELGISDSSNRSRSQQVSRNHNREQIPKHRRSSERTQSYGRSRGFSPSNNKYNNQRSRDSESYKSSHNRDNKDSWRNEDHRTRSSKRHADSYSARTKRHRSRSR